MTDTHKPPSHATTGNFLVTGEGPLSAEVKAARNELVDTTNAFLEELAADRKKGRDAATGGLMLQEAGLIRETVLGKNNKRQQIGVDYEGGISLTGDGQTTPLELQAVLPSSVTEDGATLITMHGTDPTARQIYSDHGYADSRANEVIIDFEVREELGGISMHSGYRVDGDGEFYYRYLSNEGAAARTPVQDIKTAQQAQAELDQAITTIRQALYPATPGTAS